MLPVMNSNSWLPSVFSDFFDNDWMPRMKATTAPAVNVKESAKEYTVEFAVPGIKKEFCRVNINHDGNLEIAVENKMEHKEEHKAEEKKERYLRREFSYANYQQTFVLPDDVEKEEISAKVDNGVLSITLPKMTREEEKKAMRRIEIS